MPDNVCRNCKWAQWEMTKHANPRVRKELGGKCLYPVERIALPISITVGMFWSHRALRDGDKRLIFHGNDEPCRVWENKAVLPKIRKSQEGA